MFNIYIGRIVDLHGVTFTRPVYERAIQELPDDAAIKMCLAFADMERKLGEVDRGRAVYAYTSQLCDPRVHSTFWDAWREFETAHGNKDTMSEMLRIRRSVQASFNTAVSFFYFKFCFKFQHQKNAKLLKVIHFRHTTVKSD